MIDPARSATIGYHLFLEPVDELRNALTETIQKLASEFGGPVFPPHVTLLARIEAEESKIEETCEALAKHIPPFTLTLGTPAHEHAYFRALYLGVGEGKLISEHHAHANSLFHMFDEGTYTPHLSLLYGNYEPKVIKGIMNTVPSFEGRSFICDRFYLYQTHGEATQWKKLKEYKLS
ncbi:MAG: 2'-5' RNA ligase family protein [Patescibacteria group bacterium]